MLGIRKTLFCNKGGEALGQFAQRGGGSPVHGDTQGQVGPGSEHLIVPVHCRGVDQITFKCHFQIKQFNDSMIL